MKIASIQLNAEFADVASNLEQCENYIRKVASAGVAKKLKFLTDEYIEVIICA